MQIRRLKLVNFRQHAETEFELGPGLTGIIGPNGAGKTTLLEAVAWAIYGNPAARGSRDSIPRMRMPPRSRVVVEMDFALGGHGYRIVRGLHDAQLFLDRGPEPVSSGTREVTAAVTKLLGMTHEEFFNTYFTGQKELAVMATLGPADRGRFLSRVLGYERLRTAQEAARHTRKQRSSELDGLRAGLGDEAELVRGRQQAEGRRAQVARLVESAVAVEQQATQALAVAGPEWSRMTEIRTKVLALDGDRRAAEHQVVDARREHERLDKELAEALTARSRLEELAPHLVEVEPLRVELRRLEEEGRRAGHRRDLSGQLKEVEKQLERSQERLAEIGDAVAASLARDRELDAARLGLRQAEGEVGGTRAAWLQEREHVRTKRDELREQYKEIKDQRDRIVELGTQGLCPTCGRPLGKDFEQMAGTLSRQLEQIETNGQYFTSRVTQLETEPPELQAQEQVRVAAASAVQLSTQAVADARSRVRERSELQQAFQTLSIRASTLKKEIDQLPEQYDTGRHDVVRDRLRTLEPQVLQGQRLAAQAERATLLVSEMEVAEQRLSEREARARVLAEAIADLGFSEARYLAARAAHEAAERGFRSAHDAVASRTSDLRLAERDVESAVQRLAERTKRASRIDELKAVILVHEELDTALGEIRDDLNSEMRPELSEVASELLTSLTGGHYTELELDESYGLMLMDGGLPKPVISGGEEDVANLALRIALSRLVAERAGQPVSLLVLDEIFGSLDEVRREGVIRVLQGLRDQFPQVLLLTHIDSIRGISELDRILRVSIDPESGASVVRDEQGERAHPGLELSLPAAT